MITSSAMDIEEISRGLRCDICGRRVEMEDYYVLTFYKTFDRVVLEKVVCEECYDSVLGKLKEIFGEGSENDLCDDP